MPSPPRVVRTALVAQVKFAERVELGAGGDVVRTGECFAVKVLLKDCVRRRMTVNNEPVREDAMEEIRIMQYLNRDAGHVHVLRLVDVLHDSTYIFLILECCPGGDLYKFVTKRRRLDEDTARRVFLELLQGLCYMHGRGIVHRDLSLGAFRRVPSLHATPIASTQSSSGNAGGSAREGLSPLSPPSPPSPLSSLFTCLFLSPSFPDRQRTR